MVAGHAVGIELRDDFNALVRIRAVANQITSAQPPVEPLAP
jgi:hypothetical protein